MPDGLSIGWNAQGPLLVISREGVEVSPAEASPALAILGWPSHSSEWFTDGKGQKYLLLRPQAESEPVKEAPPPAPEYPGDEVVRTLLLDRTQPWRATLKSPGVDIREAAVRSMSSADLVAEFSWLTRKWLPALRAALSAYQQSVIPPAET